LAVAAAVAVFVVRVGAAALSDLNSQDIAVAWQPVLAALMLLALARALDTFAWHALLRGTGSGLPLAASARSLALAELFRYVPGGVLHVGARYKLATETGVSRDATVTAISADLGLRLFAAVALCCGSLALWPEAPAAVAWVSTGGVAAAALLLHPRVRRELAMRFGRALGAEGVSGVELPSRALGRCLALNLVSFALQGGAAFAIVVALADMPVSSLPIVAGMVTFAWLVGVLTPYAPGGLGAREGTGAALLEQVVTLSVAAVAMLLLRVASLVVELGFALLVTIWWRATTRTTRLGTTVEQPGAAG
jgi:glycosyltransferase 2 family protein